jgi:hypothetical protein
MDRVRSKECVEERTLAVEHSDAELKRLSTLVEDCMMGADLDAITETLDPYDAMLVRESPVPCASEGSFAAAAGL